MICSADATDFSLFVQRGAHCAVGGGGGGGEGMQTLLICKKKKKLINECRRKITKTKAGRSRQIYLLLIFLYSVVHHLIIT